MHDRFRTITSTFEVSSIDKTRLKGFMQQELAYYNALVEGLGPRARTFPETLLALHQDWEALWAVIAAEGRSLRAYQWSKDDVQLPECFEPHRRMLVGKNSKGERFLDERMFNIMSIAASPGTLHPTVRRNMAVLALEFYKDQAAKLIKRNDEAFGDDDLYNKPIDLLVSHDIVTKRHLQIPRSALNAVYYYEKVDETHIFHPYSENAVIIPGYDFEHNNHWNMMMIHQQAGVDVTPSSPWVVDIMRTNRPYDLRYVDQDNPKTGQIFAIAKKKSY